MVAREVDSLRKLRNDYMQLARDHRGWAGNTYMHYVAFARDWNKHLVRYLQWARRNGHAAART